MSAQESEALQELIESGLWERHEGGTGDACNVCGKEMPANPLTAIFGVHRECAGKKEGTAMKHEWKGGMTPSTPDSPPEGYCYCEACGVEMDDDNKDGECEPLTDEVVDAYLEAHKDDPVDEQQVERVKRRVDERLAR